MQICLEVLLCLFTGNSSNIVMAPIAKITGAPPKRNSINAAKTLIVSQDCYRRKRNGPGLFSAPWDNIQGLCAHPAKLDRVCQGTLLRCWIERVGQSHIPYLKLKDMQGPAYGVSINMLRLLCTVVSTFPGKEFPGVCHI